MYKHNPNVLFTAIALSLCQFAYTEGPVCSEFDYNKRVIEFMTETKHDVKTMANDLRKTEEYMLAVSDRRKSEMDKLVDELTQKLQKGMLNITKRVGRIEEKYVGETVAFSAFKPFDKSLQTNEILILQSTLLNEGNGYDTKSGIFTAPTSGLYQFTAHVCNAHGLVIHYAIVKDGDWIAGSQQFEQASENSHKYASCSSVNALTRMNIGDQVWIMCTSGYSSSKQIFDDTFRRNSFIGVLLHK